VLLLFIALMYILSSKILDIPIFIKSRPDDVFLYRK
jgi:hypothetical protein